MRTMQIAMACFIFMTLATGLAGQAPEWVWAVAAGGVNSDYANDIISDAGGNLYVTGSFSGSAAFGTITLTSSGGPDVFVAKLDGDGNWLWAVQASSSTMAVEGLDIALDVSGQIYVTGTFGGTATFGGISITSHGQTDAFVAKLDGDGNWLWAKGAGGSYMDNGKSIGLDQSGNVYCGGDFASTATFGSISLTSDGGADIFIAKLDSAGNWLWAQQAGGEDTESVENLTVSEGGTAYLTGYFYTEAAFGSFILTGYGETDVYVAAINTNGAWQWASKAGGASDDMGSDIILDPLGYLCVTGNFGTTAVFGPHVLTSLGNQDLFVGRLNLEGNWVWAKRGGGTGNESGLDVSLDGNGNICLTGYFDGTSVIGYTTLNSSGYLDILTAAINSDGIWLWALKAGGANDDYGYGLVADGNGIYVTGRFYASATFSDINIGLATGPNIFVAKISPGVGTSDDLAADTSASPKLGDPAPNPFRRGEATRLKVEIGQGDEGLLSVFNLRGQLIEKRSLGQGFHEVCFDLCSQPAGIYLCRLKTRTAVLSRKLVLLE